MGLILLAIGVLIGLCLNSGGAAPQRGGWQPKPGKGDLGTPPNCGSGVHRPKPDWRYMVPPAPVDNGVLPRDQMHAPMPKVSPPLVHPVPPLSK